jgi:DNA primase
MLLDHADLSSPAGRDRALDEVVEVIAAMPDSITREELMREVADRLDADPGLVGRRVGKGGRRRAVEAAEDAAASDGPTPTRRELSVRERREMALLAMCVRNPEEGRSYLERLEDEHFSAPVGARARDWLLAHLDEPLQGLARDDEELWGYVTQVVMESERELSSRGAIEVGFDVLDRDLLDRRIADAERTEGSPPVELQKRRAELNERIARSGAI